MDSIEKWFESKLDYSIGVDIYKSLPTAKARLVQKFERGKSNHNMAQLIKELRMHKATAGNTSTKDIIKKVSPITTFPEVSTDKEIANHYHKKKLKESSEKIVFGSILYGELPPELRIRYQEASTLFYQMCDLKFALNDMPKESVNESLSIQLQIDSIDVKRETIWKELHHFQTHKTVLPSSAESFKGHSEGDLFRKRNNFRSQVTKLNNRINGYYEKLSEVSDKHQKILLENQIIRSKKKLHQHTLNIDKINELL